MKNPERVAALLAELEAECEYRFEFDAVAELKQAVSGLPRVTVLDDGHQEFLGAIFFRRAPDGHFYRSNDYSSRALHREVWKCYYGDIPKGCEIHHIDGNPANNDIENLQCLSKADHRRIHKASHTTAICEVCGKTFLTRANLPGLMCSAECRAKRRRQQEVTVTCVCCGKEFVTRKAYPAQTCSSNCAHTLAQQTRQAGTAKPHGKKEIRTCAFCGKPFEVRKDAKTKCCSLSCAQRRRQKHRHANNVLK